MATRNSSLPTKFTKKERYFTIFYIQKAWQTADEKKKNELLDRLADYSHSKRRTVKAIVCLIYNVNVYIIWYYISYYKIIYIDNVLNIHVFSWISWIFSLTFFCSFWICGLLGLYIWHIYVIIYHIIWIFNYL